MTPPRQRILLLPFMFAVLLTATAAWAVEVNKPAPDFQVEDLQGTGYNLQDMTGTALLLFFFSPENPFCVAHAPKVESKIWAEYSWHNFQLLGINMGPQDAAAVEEFRKATDISFPLVANGADVGASYEAGVNQFVVIDVRGIVRYISTTEGAAAYNEQELRQAISSALEGVAPPRESTWGRIKKLFEGDLLRGSRPEESR